jgi:tRNA A58 N-methylase Trm61
VILRATFQDIVVRAKRKCTPVYPKDMAQLAMLLDLKEGDRGCDFIHSEMNSLIDFFTHFETF